VTAGNLTYGQKLSESNLTGGSTGYGTFAWKDGNIIHKKYKFLLLL